MAQSCLLVAVAAGTALALALGGRPRHLAGKTFRWWLLLPLGVVLQRLVDRPGVPAPFALLVASYVYLLVFCAANLRHRGMGVVLVGIALNLLVIALNHGMPVRTEAVQVAASDVGGVAVIVGDVAHHVDDGHTRLGILGDAIAVRPLHQAVSFGDLVLAVGVVDLLVHLFRPDAGRPIRPPTRLSAAES